MQVDYFRPLITSNDKKSVIHALSQRWLTDGPFRKSFQNKFSKFLTSKYSLAVGNATMSLHLALKALGIKENDEVIVPTFTFTATGDAVRFCNAKPILVDVNLDDFNISIEQIEKKLSKKTKAIIPVHYGGQSCQMDQIMSIAKKNNLYVIEDCAHALGSSFKNKKCGNIGDIGCFSFYPTKIITTGEGGMLSTNNKQVFQKAKLISSHGMNLSASERESKTKWKYDIVELGYNYRLDEIRSSLGVSQISRIKYVNKSRQKIAKEYDKHLKKIKGIVIPSKKQDRNHIYHLYTIRITKDYHLTRNELFEKLSNNKIGSSVQYFPLHLMSSYKNNFKLKMNDFPNSNKLKDEVISLPIYPQLTQKQIDYVISNLT